MIAGSWWNCIRGDLGLCRFLHVPILSLAMFAASAVVQQAVITRPDGIETTPAQVDSTVNRLIQAAHVSGAGVALFHQGNVVYLKAIGLRDVERKLPLTPDSVMSGASLTKAAFATVVMKLVEDGLLDLDKPIEQYLGKPLGDFPQYLILTNSSNGEGIFEPLIEALLGQTRFPFEWEHYTPYDKLTQDKLK